MSDRLYLSSRFGSNPIRWLLVAVLLTSYGLMVSSAVRKSATVDEAAHVHRGLAYLWLGESGFRLGHPVTGHAIASLPAMIETEVRFPVDHPAWQEKQWGVAGNLFMWETGNNGLRLLFLARLMGIWFALVLGAIVYRWGAEVASPWVGLTAAALVCLDPNLIAHARLVTNDVTVATCFVLCLYGVWRIDRADWVIRSNRGRTGTIMAAIGLGLGLSIKFTAAVLVPIIAGLVLFALIRLRHWRPILGGAVIGLSAWGVIWVISGFALRPLPGGVFWEDFFWQLSYVGGEHGVFLNGEMNTTGFSTYFLYAFLYKTPLPTWIGLVAAIGIAGWRIRGRAWHPLIFWLIPIGIYFGFTQSTAINIGFRYLLSILPLIALSIAYSIEVGLASMFKRSAGLSSLLAAGVALISIIVWPNYISFFNQGAGGATGGLTRLSDSNLDWGQDLVALAEWQSESGEALNLSYFGTAPPSVYGLDVHMLPTWAPATEQTRPDRQPYIPTAPAPGWYAISATNLQGVVLGGRPDTYRYFREREPQRVIGRSIYLYKVDADGETVDLAVSGLIPQDIPTEVIAELGTNDIDIRWYDATTGGISTEGTLWIAVRADQPLPAEADVVAAWNGGRLATLEGYVDPVRSYGQLVQSFGNQDLLRVEVDERADGWAIRTAWEVSSRSDHPLKLFIHGLDSAGEIVTQVDRLDVDSTVWKAGDRVTQSLWLPRPSDDRPVIQLRIGLYDSVTGVRPAEPFLLDLESTASSSAATFASADQNR